MKNLKLILRIILIILILPIVSLIGLDESIKLPTEYFMEENTLLSCILFGFLLNIGMIICFLIISFILWLFDAYDE